MFYLEFKIETVMVVAINVIIIVILYPFIKGDIINYDADIVVITDKQECHIFVIENER